MTSIQRFILTEVILTWFSQKTGWTNFSCFILDSKKIILQMSHGCLRCLNFTCHHCLPEYLQHRRTVFFFGCPSFWWFAFAAAFVMYVPWAWWWQKVDILSILGRMNFCDIKAKCHSWVKFWYFFWQEIDCTSFHAARFIFNYIP